MFKFPRSLVCAGESDTNTPALRAAILPNAVRWRGSQLVQQPVLPPRIARQPPTTCSTDSNPSGESWWLAWSPTNARKKPAKKCLQYQWYCCYITCLILVLGFGTALQVNIHVLFLLVALVLWDEDHTTRFMRLRNESSTSENLYVVRHTRRAITGENAIRRVLYVKQSVDLFQRLRYSHTDNIIMKKTPPFSILATDRCRAAKWEHEFGPLKYWDRGFEFCYLHEYM